MEVYMDFVTGIDVYSLNSPDDSTNATDKNMKAANWKAVYDYGVRFAYIKASEYRADEGFTERMQLAKNAGVLRGAYILPHFELNNIADQVNLFIQTVGSDKGELPPALTWNLLAVIGLWVDRCSTRSKTVWIACRRHLDASPSFT